MWAISVKRLSRKARTCQPCWKSMAAALIAAATATAVSARTMQGLRQDFHRIYRHVAAEAPQEMAREGIHATDVRAEVA